MNELLQAQQREVGSLVVIEMKETLQSDERTTTPTLIIPSGTHGAWQALLDEVDDNLSDQRFLGVGTPGVGKSRSLNYLIREIINRCRKKTGPMPAIVFEHRKDGIVWLFVPTDQHNPQSAYEAYSMRLGSFEATGTAVLFDCRNYYIIDSGKAEEAKTPFSVRAKTIYACSPDFRHFSEYRKSLQLGATYYIPLWKEQEIFDSIPYILGANQMSELQGTEGANEARILKTVKQRVAEVGPIPRRVFSTQKDYQKFKTRLKTTMVDYEGDIFLVLKSGMDVLEADQYIDKPLSSVFAVDVEVDPVSQKPNYKSRIVRFVSNYARSRLGLRTVCKMWDYLFDNSDPQKNTALGYEFERLVYCLLQTGWETTMQVMPLSNPPLKLKLRLQQGAQDVSMVETGDGFYERGYELMQAMKLVTETSTKQPDGSLLLTQTGAAAPIFLGSNFPVIDAADARNRGFRLTIAKTNTVNKSALQKLLAGVKLKEEKMHIVFLVPSGVPQTLRPLYAKSVLWYRAEIPSPHKSPDVWGKLLRRQFSTVRSLMRTPF